MNICALIPAWNEGATIEQVVTEVRPHVQAVIVVDDGSTDATSARAQRAGARVIRHEHNRGKGHAIRTGVAAVLSEPFTHVLFLDGDLQHAPGDAPKLIAAARTPGVDVVLGERPFVRDAMPLSRYYSNTIGSAILSRFIGVTVGDSQSGYRLIATDLLRRITLTARGYEVETEMLIKLARAGARMARAPIRLSYEGAKSKLRPVRDTTRTCFLAVHYRFLSRH
jgi:glycosyltransferase involved in cell wall biosynthesis